MIIILIFCNNALNWIYFPMAYHLAHPRLSFFCNLHTTNLCILMKAICEAVLWYLNYLLLPKIDTKYHESPVMGFLFSGNVKIKYHNEAPVIISRSVKYFEVFVLPMAISHFPASSSLMIFLSMSHRSRWNLGQYHVHFG